MSKLEERYKAGIEPGDPRWYTHCQVCGKTEAEVGEKFAYSAGQFHYPTCYEVLFDICEECHQRNMSVVTNEHEYGEKLCDTHYLKKHGLVVDTIVFGPFTDSRGIVRGGTPARRRRR